VVRRSAQHVAQQLCAALSVSESTIRRLEQSGLPYTPVGKRLKRYDLANAKTG
jgi:hypothetical protein